MIAALLLISHECLPLLAVDRGPDHAINVYEALPRPRRRNEAVKLLHIAALPRLNLQRHSRILEFLSRLRRSRWARGCRMGRNRYGRRSRCDLPLRLRLIDDNLGRSPRSRRKVCWRMAFLVVTLIAARHFVY